MPDDSNEFFYPTGGQPCPARFIAAHPLFVARHDYRPTAMAAFRSQRAERSHLAAVMRAEGRTWVEIAEQFRQRYQVNALKAMRWAHGWSQADLARRWCDHWPDNPRAADSISAWERWPQAGNEPSLHVLDRLAEIYQCDVADLVADRSTDERTYARHRHLDTAVTRSRGLKQAAPANPAANLIELTRFTGTGGPTWSAGAVADLVDSLEQAAQAATADSRSHVLRLLGHAHEAMGEVAFDQLRLADAADHFHQAHELGVEVGDPDLASMARIQLGDIARRRRRYFAAVGLLESAERDAAAASRLTQVRSSQTLARTCAETGDGAAFDRAIGRAEQLAESVPAEYHRGGDHSPRGVRFEKAQGLTLLGQPKAALAIYEASAPTSFRNDRERGSFLIIYAQALAHAGHLDEGVRLAIEGLELARSYGSPRHVSRVQRMHDRLVATWPFSEPTLVELREALAVS